jgi:hypothetical protein
VENHQREQLARVLTGAAISAGFAFLFMTKNGKRLLDSAEPWLDEVIRDMQRLRGTAAKVRDAVDEGRRSFETIARLGSFSETGGTTGQQASWASEAKH